MSSSVIKDIKKSLLVQQHTERNESLQVKVTEYYTNGIATLICEITPLVDTDTGSILSIQLPLRHNPICTVIGSNDITQDSTDRTPCCQVGISTNGTLQVVGKSTKNRLAWGTFVYPYGVFT